MSTRPTIRRFPDRITRQRSLEGMRNEYGEFIEGALIEVELQASIQPVSLEDLETEGGELVSHRLKLYVRNVEPQAVDPGKLLWGSDALTWDGDALTFGGSHDSIPVEGPVLSAGFFAEQEADKIIIGGNVYEVTEVKNWRGSHTEALVLREN